MTVQEGIELQRYGLLDAGVDAGLVDQKVEPLALSLPLQPLAHLSRAVGKAWAFTPRVLVCATTAAASDRLWRLSRIPVWRWRGRSA